MDAQALRSSLIHSGNLATPQLLDNALINSSEFRMYCFKILPCSRKSGHDWTACPFAHQGEKATRRCPQQNKYLPLACPEVKKNSFCPKGDSCQYAHNVFEYWCHPLRFRTQLCSNGENCRRPICFFAHTYQELRVVDQSLLQELEQQMELLGEGGAFGFPPSHKMKGTTPRTTMDTPRGDVLHSRRSTADIPSIGGNAPQQNASPLVMTMLDPSAAQDFKIKAACQRDSHDGNNMSTQSQLALGGDGTPSSCSIADDSGSEVSVGSHAGSKEHSDSGAATDANTTGSTESGGARRVSSSVQVTVPSTPRLDLSKVATPTGGSNTAFDANSPAAQELRKLQMNAQRQRMANSQSVSSMERLFSPARLHAAATLLGVETSYLAQALAAMPAPPSSPALHPDQVSMLQALVSAAAAKNPPSVKSTPRTPGRGSAHTGGNANVGNISLQLNIPGVTANAGGGAVPSDALLRMLLLEQANNVMAGNAAASMAPPQLPGMGGLHGDEDQLTATAKILAEMSSVRSLAQHHHQQQAAVLETLASLANPGLSNAHSMHTAMSNNTDVQAIMQALSKLDAQQVIPDTPRQCLQDTPSVGAFGQAAAFAAAAAANAASNAASGISAAAAKAFLARNNPGALPSIGSGQMQMQTDFRSGMGMMDGQLSSRLARGTGDYNAAASDGPQSGGSLIPGSFAAQQDSEGVEMHDLMRHPDLDQPGVNRLMGTLSELIGDDEAKAGGKAMIADANSNHLLRTFASAFPGAPDAMMMSMMGGNASPWMGGNADGSAKKLGMDGVGAFNMHARAGGLPSCMSTPVTDLSAAVKGRCNLFDAEQSKHAQQKHKDEEDAAFALLTPAGTGSYNAQSFPKDL